MCGLVGVELEAVLSIFVPIVNLVCLLQMYLFQTHHIKQKKNNVKYKTETKL